MVRRVFPNGKREVICSLWNMSLSVETSMKLVTAREATPLWGSWLTAYRGVMSLVSCLFLKAFGRSLFRMKLKDQK